MNNLRKKQLAWATLLCCPVACLAGSQTLTFQEGVNGYTGAFDTMLRYLQPDTAYGSEADNLWTDGFSGSDLTNDQPLLKFTNILGGGSSQVPVGARILKARLVFTRGSSGNAPGNGGTVNRLLKDWDAATTTWNSFGGGVAADDVKAKSTSTYHVGGLTINGSNSVVHAGSSTKLMIDVTSDVQAWANGSNNYGWAVLPYAEGTNGWSVRASEAAHTAMRPYLEVTYTTDPLVGKVTSFQNGVNGYSGTKDSYYSQTNADTTYDGVDIAWVDGDENNATEGTNHSYATLKFNDLFGTDANQIALDGEILSATLSIQTFGSNASGNGGSLYRVINSWSELGSYNNTFGGDGVTLGVDAQLTATATFGGLGSTNPVPYGQLDFDVTSDLKAWLAGEANNGWAFIPFMPLGNENGSADGWSFIQSDYANSYLRPVLTVEWKPVPEPASMIALALGVGGLLARRRRNR